MHQRSALPVLLILFLLFISFSNFARLHSQSGTERWKAGDILYEMSKVDLIAWKTQKEGPVLFSMRRLLADQKKEFDEGAKERALELRDEPRRTGDESAMHDHSVTIEPVSVVGSYISYLYSSAGYSYRAAHPYAYQSIEARNIANDAENKRASLLDFYSEQQIVDALKQDPWIRKFGMGDRALNSVRSVKALADALNEARISANEHADTCELDAWFNEDIVEHFAFYDLTSQNVAIRLGVPYGSEVCRGTLHQIGLVLEVPEKMRGDLEKAKKRQAGFLMSGRKSAGSLTYRESWEVDLFELLEE